MPGLRYLSESDAEAVVTSLTEDVFPGAPAFQLRGEEGRSALLSALAQPHWPYYRTLPEKAGALHFSLNKNHPFADGNKRFALTAMEVFLVLNKARLVAGAAELEAYALGVAGGTIDRDEAIAFVRHRTIRHYWGKPQIQRWVQRLPADDLPSVAEEMRDPTNPFLRFYESLVAERAREDA